MKSNLDPKVESALCYVPFIGWIAAIIFLIIEKNADVRFNAAQGLVLMVGIWIVMFLMGVTIILAILTPVIWLASIILEIVLAVKAYQGQKVLLPVIGPWAQKLLGKVAAK
ncbi:MAG: DUF4870 domain-containing protein [Patescibacteria group bacterium]|nr:DUF4870 domain-containing protein [Patescibacteria group bacterium]MCL5431877.1 DUF4870 domain-containing protein [Patescibacteria group bacterium]